MAVPSYRSFPSPLLGMGLNGGQNVPIKESSGDYEHPMDVESVKFHSPCLRRDVDLTLCAQRCRLCHREFVVILYC